jgi:hypothetical protein
MYKNRLLIIYIQMGFSKRKRTNKQINGTTMIVPGSDPNLGLGGSKNFNVNITKNRFGGQSSQTSSPSTPNQSE